MRSLLCVSLVLTMAHVSFAQQDCLRFCRADCDQAYPPGSPDNDECKELCRAYCDDNLCCICDAATQTCNCSIGPCSNMQSTQTNLLSPAPSPMPPMTMSGTSVVLTPNYSWGGTSMVLTTPMVPYAAPVPIMYPAPVTYSAPVCSASSVSSVWPTAYTTPVQQACQPRCFRRQVRIRQVCPRRCCW